MIQTRGLKKDFGSVTALNDVSLDVGEGEVVGLLGRNGAGKTTLIDLLLGLTRPTSGDVRIAGTTPHDAVRDARIGAVMQTGGLLPDLTVRDTVAMIASTHHDPMSVDSAIEAAGLQDIAGRRVGKCSGGQQQRVRFALALLGHPDILVLDEPTTGMDPAARHTFWDAMHEQARNGRTILFSTHYLEEAEQMARRIVILDKGQVIADGSATELREATGWNWVSAVVDKQYAQQVPGAEYRDGTLTVRTGNSDELVRWLLTETDARNLTVTPSTLEDTFIELTGKEINS